MKRDYGENTIVAVSSPRGVATRGIIRLSGPRTYPLLEEIFYSGREKWSFGAQREIMNLPSLPSFPVLLLTMPSPHSYTTEDMAEIHCQGSPLLLEKVAEHFLRRDISLAGPGEFTRRAFLNGRIDLLQAEAVLRLIEASSASELRKAQQFLKGKVGRKLDETAELLKEILAEIHAYIDFPDYDVAPESESSYHRKISQAREWLHFARQSSRKEQKRQVPTLAFWGYANVGKSTLFNALAGSQKAIVADEEFTTRDVLTEEITLGDTSWMIMDLASFRSPENKLEEIALSRSREALKGADLIVFVAEGYRPLHDEEKKELGELLEGETPFVVAVNKSEKGPRVLDLDESIPSREVFPHEPRGLDSLKGEIEKIYQWSEGEEEVFFNERQLQIYHRALEALDRALDLPPGSEELIAFEVEEALGALGELTGEVVTDEILDIVFSRFCIGK